MDIRANQLSDEVEDWKGKGYSGVEIVWFLTYIYDQSFKAIFMNRTCEQKTSSKVEAL